MQTRKLKLEAFYDLFIERVLERDYLNIFWNYVATRIALQQVLSGATQFYFNSFLLSFPGFPDEQLVRMCSRYLQ